MGLVTYSNISKRDFLKVSPETIRKFGAVSQEVVIEMIHGLFSLTEADIALSVSGVLGPEKDASSAKPLGTVWMAISHRTTLSNPHTQLVPLQKPRSRIFNRNFVVRYLLQTLYDYQQT